MQKTILKKAFMFFFTLGYWEMACAGGHIVTISSNNVSCYGGCSGTATVTVSGGVGPFGYSWSPGNLSGKTISNLCVGIYTCYVTDSSDMSVASAFDTITSPKQITATTIVNNLSCAWPNCNGSATVNILGGAGMNGNNCGTDMLYGYVWCPDPSQNSGIVWSPGGHFGTNPTNLCPGTYTINITDASGCTAYTSATIMQRSCSNAIRGKVFNDTLQNCIEDKGEKGLKNWLVKADISPYTYFGLTDSVGNYLINVDLGSFNVTTVPLKKYWVINCPTSTSYLVKHTISGDTTKNIDFGINEKLNVQDLRINITSGRARPGRVQNISICYSNDGNITMDGTIIFTHDSLLTYISATLPENSYIYPNAQWNFTNLKAGEERCITVSLQVPIPTDGGTLGRELKTYAFIEPMNTDTFPSDNEIHNTTIITGSFDPNEKQVSPDGNITSTDSLLTYIIHFQNTGTDTAFKIVVRDTLSPFVDVPSVIPGAASHPYRFDISGKGVLSWTFNNILLVDSNTNEPLSHGYLSYKIKLKKDLQIGTQIKNKADIYFDYNIPVTTNSTLNTITLPTSVSAPALVDGYILVYPNPFSDNVSFTLSNKPANERYTLTLHDMLGKTVRSIANITSNQFDLSASGLEQGIYFYKIHSSNALIGVGKLVLKH